MLKKIILVILAGVGIIACDRSGSFTREERDRVGLSGEAGIMPLFIINHQADSLFLRQKAKELVASDMNTEIFRVLKARMLATVNDTLNQGVGIAAPQVGISRQLITIQRFDKTGEPFEFYVNPDVVYRSKDSLVGQEGCLSIPDRLDSLFRSREVIVRFRDEYTFEWRQDTVKSFTARIFQHEIDHLKGILYIDYIP